MYKNFKPYLISKIIKIKNSGLYKKERIITSPQNSAINTNKDKDIINLCANNYLGLSSHPEIINAAKKTIDSHGYGMSSVRFICGTQDIHKKLEKVQKLKFNIIYAFYAPRQKYYYAHAFY